jgi:hypothetical protein
LAASLSRRQKCDGQDDKPSHNDQRSHRPGGYFCLLFGGAEAHSEFPVVRSACELRLMVPTSIDENLVSGSENVQAGLSITKKCQRLRLLAKPFHVERRNVILMLKVAV